MPTKELKVGDQAPDFVLKNQGEAEIRLSHYRGKWVILYFYPKDNTPGCTIEAIDFTRFLKDFERLNTVILGMSPDSCASHAKFAKGQNLKITLLSDTDQKTLKTYGVWQEKSFMGKKFWGVVRSTFVINPEGKIVHLWRAIKANGHAQAVKEKLEELQKELSSV